MDFKYAGYGLETSWTRLPDDLRIPHVGARRTGQKVAACRFDQAASFRLKTTGFFVSSVHASSPFTVKLGDASPVSVEGHALVVVGPGIDFASDFTGPLEGNFVTMPAEDLRTVLGAEVGPFEIASTLYRSDDKAAIRPLMSAIADCLMRKEETDPFAYEAILHAIARLLAVRVLSTKRAPHLAVDQTCKLRNMILDGLSGPLSVGDLAQAVNLSEGHFARAFKVSFGESPYQYISRERTALAQTLIANEDMLLEDVAARAGFSSIAQMTRAMKAHSGETSRAMRASRLSSNVQAAAIVVDDGELV